MKYCNMLGDYIVLILMIVWGIWPFILFDRYYRFPWWLANTISISQITTVTILLWKYTHDEYATGVYAVLGIVFILVVWSYPGR